MSLKEVSQYTTNGMKTINKNKCRFFTKDNIHYQEKRCELNIFRTGVMDQRNIGVVLVVIAW